MRDYYEARLFGGLGLRAALREVDGSSLFCVAVKGPQPPDARGDGGPIRRTGR